jgi:hypothetical protein
MPCVQPETKKTTAIPQINFQIANQPGLRIVLTQTLKPASFLAVCGPTKVVPLLQGLCASVVA